MTIVIENASEDLAKVIKGIAKIANAKVKTNKLKSDIEAEILDERAEILEQYKKGTLKTFDNIQEYRKSMNV